MKVTSSGIINGVIKPEYGNRGTQFNENNVPTFSLPFQIEGAPEGTVSFAIVLEDKDAYPVTGGFVWIHWLAANITRTEIRENEARQQTILFREGTVGRAFRAADSPQSFHLIMAV